MTNNWMRSCGGENRLGGTIRFAGYQLGCDIEHSGPGNILEMSIMP